MAIPVGKTRRRRRLRRGYKGQTFQLPPCRVTPQRVKLILSTSQKDSPYPTPPLWTDIGHPDVYFDFFPRIFSPVTYWRFAIFIFNLTVRVQDFDSTCFTFSKSFCLKKGNLKRNELKPGHVILFVLYFL